MYHIYTSIASILVLKQPKYTLFTIIKLQILIYWATTIISNTERVLTLLYYQIWVRVRNHIELVWSAGGNRSRRHQWKSRPQRNRQRSSSARRQSASDALPRLWPSYAARSCSAGLGSSHAIWLTHSAPTAFLISSGTSRSLPGAQDKLSFHLNAHSSSP